MSTNASNIMNIITITLPQFDLKKEKIHTNYIRQIGLPESTIEGLICNNCEYNNYWKILTPLSEPFDVIYIKQWNKRTETINDVPILKLSNATDLASIDVC